MRAFAITGLFVALLLPMCVAAPPPPCAVAPKPIPKAIVVKPPAPLVAEPFAGSSWLTFTPSGHGSWTFLPSAVEVQRFAANGRLYHCGKGGFRWSSEAVPKVSEFPLPEWPVACFSAKGKSYFLSQSGNVSVSDTPLGPVTDLAVMMPFEPTRIVGGYEFAVAFDHFSRVWKFDGTSPSWVALHPPVGRTSQVVGLEAGKEQSEIVLFLAPQRALYSLDGGQSFASASAPAIGFLALTAMGNQTALIGYRAPSASVVNVSAWNHTVFGAPSALSADAVMASIDPRAAWQYEVQSTDYIATRADSERRGADLHALEVASAQVVAYDRHTPPVQGDYEPMGNGPQQSKVVRNVKTGAIVWQTEGQAIPLGQAAQHSAGVWVSPNDVFGWLETCQRNTCSVCVFGPYSVDSPNRCGVGSQAFPPFHDSTWTFDDAQNLYVGGDDRFVRVTPAGEVSQRVRDFPTDGRQEITMSGTHVLATQGTPVNWQSDDAGKSWHEVETLGFSSFSCNRLGCMASEGAFRFWDAPWLNIGVSLPKSHESESPIDPTPPWDLSLQCELKPKAKLFSADVWLQLVASPVRPILLREPTDDSVSAYSMVDSSVQKSDFSVDQLAHAQKLPNGLVSFTYTVNSKNEVARVNVSWFDYTTGEFYHARASSVSYAIANPQEGFKPSFEITRKGLWLRPPAGAALLFAHDGSVQSAEGQWQFTDLNDMHWALQSRKNGAEISKLWYLGQLELSRADNLLLLRPRAYDSKVSAFGWLPEGELESPPEFHELPAALLPCSGPLDSTSSEVFEVQRNPYWLTGLEGMVRAVTARIGRDNSACFETIQTEKGIYFARTGLAYTVNSYADGSTEVLVQTCHPKGKRK